MLKILLLSLFALCQLGCAMPGMPGYITQTTSKFDNTTQLQMQPAWASNEGYVQLALFWSSALEKDMLILETHVNPPPIYTSLDSLKIRVGNQKWSFKAIDEINKTYVMQGYAGQGHIFSIRRYEIPINVIENMVRSNSSVLRIEAQSEFIERELENSSESRFAREPFKEFLAKLREIKPGT